MVRRALRHESQFLTAHFIMSKYDVEKIVQNWWFWIVGDVLVIGL
jgi:hypothetical protein